MTLPPWSQRRQPIGEKRKQAGRWEAEQAVQFERLLSLHQLDYWHCTVAQRSQAGFPDYVVFGKNWMGFAELKAVNPETGRRGKVSAAQLRYKESIEAAGAEWRLFCLPDDWGEVDTWLNAHTDKPIWGSK